MLLWILACARSAPITVPFVAVDGPDPVVCGQPDSSGRTVHDLRLFVHDLQLIDASGKRFPLTLTPGPFQTDTVAMLDFEDGCDNGTSPTHTTLSGTAPVGDYTALSLALGLPADLNHANPATAAGPLSATSMHWSWQGGYKFLRLDYSTGAVRAKVHIGSTGCKGEIGAPEGCRRDNRAVFTVPLKAGELITVDVATLVGEGDCMAGADEAGCVAPFSALGLDLIGGRSAGSGRFFR